MAATRRTTSILHLSARMRSPQLLLATIALSSSWSGNAPPLTESFSILRHQQNPHHTSVTLMHRHVHLPPRDRRPTASSLSENANDESGGSQSVTGPIYEMDNGPVVKLFTKEGCTLCDKVKDVSVTIKKYACYLSFV